MVDDIQIQTVDTAALTATGEIDIQIATAKQYPRSVASAMKEARELATLDEETAASMFYALPRDGKTIEGPSARLAEIMAYSWGNLRVDADIVGEEGGFIVAQGTCFDLERNVAVRVRVKRRITGKNGKRYKDDMVGVTGNAAVSIALRNSVFKVIPAALVSSIYFAARTASLGKGGTLTQKRQKAMDWFKKVGVQEDAVFRVLGVEGIEDVGENELITLRGLVTSIQDGETTVEQTFHAKAPVEMPTVAADKEPKAEAPDQPEENPAIAECRQIIAELPEDDQPGMLKTLDGLETPEDVERFRTLLSGEVDKQLADDMQQ
jgi:hypothetical protein